MGFLNKLFTKKKTQGDIQTRYTIEHSFLPKVFFDEERCSSLILTISEEEGSFFVNLFNVLNKDKSDYHCPYSTKQFSVKKMQFNTSSGNKIYILQVQMPKPERAPLCEEILFVHNDNLESLKYITVEKDEECSFICEWTANGDHVLHVKYSKKNMLNILDSVE